jgi:AcrR family transcriptional regulator
MATDDARTRILNTAGPIFSEKGYDATTVREICDRAGVNLASVNYYFGGKERLYIEVVKRAHPITIREIHVPEWSPATPPAAKLEDFILTIMRRIVGANTAPWQTRLIMREMLDPTTACEELVRDCFRVEFELLLGILDEILPAETPRHKRHQIAFGIIAQCVHYRTGRHAIALLIDEDELGEYYTTERLAEHISQMCLAALGLAPPLAPRPTPSEVD